MEFLEIDKLKSKQSINNVDDKFNRKFNRKEKPDKHNELTHIR